MPDSAGTRQEGRPRKGPGHRPRICWVASSPLTARAFLLRHFAALVSRYEVTLVTNAEGPEFLGDLKDDVRLVPLPLERKPSVPRDAACLVALATLLSGGDYAAVHSVTPKSGLLAMAAGHWARTPLRIHWFTGQVWATRAGLSRSFLKGMDHAIARLATHLLVDSFSQMAFLEAQGVSAKEKMRVLGRGSICGVDPVRFSPDDGVRRRVRSELGIPQGGIVFAFVGRCTYDKGLLDLAKAFARASGGTSDMYLLLVGPDEEGLVPRVMDVCGQSAGRVRWVDFTHAPEDYLRASDVLCLPSYREGFGSVVIEAAAIGLPAIASRIYGVMDAVEDGETGLLHEPRNADELASFIQQLSEDVVLRAKLGAAARRRALKEFTPARITTELVEFYAETLPC